MFEKEYQRDEQELSVCLAGVLSFIQPEMEEIVIYVVLPIVACHNIFLLQGRQTSLNGAG